MWTAFTRKADNSPRPNIQYPPLIQAAAFLTEAERGLRDCMLPSGL
ncbi:unknown [Prevotella sp. CAG:1124]|nr:unknown [Prevotella sp. CAG:1124]